MPLISPSCVGMYWLDPPPYMLSLTNSMYEIWKEASELSGVTQNISQNIPNIAKIYPRHCLLTILIRFPNRCIKTQLIYLIEQAQMRAELFHLKTVCTDRSFVRCLPDKLHRVSVHHSPNAKLQQMCKMVAEFVNLQIDHVMCIYFLFCFV